MNKTEVLKQYGKHRFCLDSYYKYKFLFRPSSGETIELYIGGWSSEIYRLTIDARKAYYVKELLEMPNPQIFVNSKLIYEEN